MPVVHRWTDDRQLAHASTTLHRFLPRTLNVRCRADTEVRRRGIVDVPLYTAQVHVEASFVLPDAAQLAPAGAEVLWKNPTLAYGISDPKAIRAASGFPWEPGAGDDNLLAAGLHAALAATRAGPVSFAFDLTVAGSGRLVVVPAGDETVVSLASPWPDPSFDGAWLPLERHVS